MTRFVLVTLAVIGLIYKAECAAPTVWTEPVLGIGDTSAPLATTVPENTAVGALAVTIVATGASDYALPSQEVDGMFTIANTGILSLASGTLDFETKSAYTLTVAAGDGLGLASGSATISTTLSITDVNDAPTFTSATYNVSAVTGSAVGTTITTVTATDQDAGDKITYAITGGNPNSDFAIAPDTGVITVAKALSMAVMHSYKLTVTGTDSGTPPLSDTSTVSFTVGNVTNVENSAVSVTSTGSLGVLLLYIYVI